MSSLKKEFNQIGNPFEPDKSNELIPLGTKDVMDVNIQHLKGQTPRVKQLSLNQGISKYTWDVFYIYIQICGGNMLKFFNHETLQYPPVLAEGGEMRSGTNSDLVKCFLPDSTASIIDAQPNAAGAVLECSVLLNLVKPKKNQLFEDYSSEVFYPQICKHQ